MSDVYRLVTINDLLNIPMDSLEACLRDIQYGIELHRLASGPDQMPPLEWIDWTDDGNHSCALYDVKGNEVFSLEVINHGDPA